MAWSRKRSPFRKMATTETSGRVLTAGLPVLESRSLPVEGKKCDDRSGFDGPRWLRADRSAQEAARNVQEAYHLGSIFQASTRPASGPNPTSHHIVSQ